MSTWGKQKLLPQIDRQNFYMESVNIFHKCFIIHTNDISFYLANVSNLIPHKDNLNENHIHILNIVEKLKSFVSLFFFINTIQTVYTTLVIASEWQYILYILSKINFYSLYLNKFFYLQIDSPSKILVRLG